MCALGLAKHNPDGDRDLDKGSSAGCTHVCVHHPPLSVSFLGFTQPLTARFHQDISVTLYQPPPCFFISFSSLSHVTTLPQHHCVIPVSALYSIILLTSLVKVSEDCGDVERRRREVWMSVCVCEIGIISNLQMWLHTCEMIACHALQMALVSIFNIILITMVQWVAWCITAPGPPLRSWLIFLTA